MRILIVTGSSGGHIFPALALADSLNNSNHKVQLALPEDVRKTKIPFNFTQTEYIPAAKLSFSLSKKNIHGAYFFLLGAWKALRMIIKFKPQVVVGFGSLNSISLIFWAWLFRIKTIIHEQNVVCGRANRLLSKLVDRVAISFSQTRNYLNVSGEKIVLTGNPLRRDLVRRERKEALDFFKFKEGRFTILITGGSQGAHRLNAACLEALSIHQKKPDLQLIHICGTQDFTWLADRYAGTALTYKLFDFFPQMQYAYSVADLIICRAGATTIAELVKFGVPAILVPYPFAYAHQLANAQVLKDIAAAEVLLDSDLSTDKLKERLQEYLCNNVLLKTMQKAYQKLPVLDATTMLANEVLSLN
ncbi:MAG: undecaprenyldiphospho-muramoylpentapeptide beta-N-acetylglucosaminyltransferase [Candidatus Omnitrophica bacterium]|nr:undecaprenyldiphospho-muramoylpentapeptide beta-N-acetylglucosaminyltransferase [Candidatus Omnitrophota bacterium]